MRRDETTHRTRIALDALFATPTWGFVLYSRAFSPIGVAGIGMREANSLTVSAKVLVAVDTAVGRRWWPELWRRVLWRWACE
jgi:hypothetical protein